MQKSKERTLCGGLIFKIPFVFDLWPPYEGYEGYDDDDDDGEETDRDCQGLE